MISPEHLEIVKAEFAATRLALEPTSRNTLALHLSRKTGIPYKNAEAVVDQFIEDTGHAIPDFLSKEFAVGWLKVVAVINVCTSMGLLWYGRVLHLRHQAPYGFWCFGVIFFGLAVLAWVKSLEKEVDNHRTDFDPAKLPLNLNSQDDAPDTTVVTR